MEIAIITDHPEITIENLKLCSALAVSKGMDKNKALGAITLNAAKNCRIDDRVGSIETGKDADLAVFTKAPTEFEARCKMTFVNGELVYGGI